MPGCPVMRSKNLADWEIVSYIFDTLNDGPRYDLKGGTVYGRGQWATSLRYHNGTYYVLFSPNDKPFSSYIYTAKDPTGPWTLASRTEHFHDSSMLFDDDGRAYVYSGTGELTEMEPDMSGVKKGGIKTRIFERDSEENGLLEGSRAVKYNGKYYLLMISWPNGGKRRQVCYRADRIDGPYEKKVILEDSFAGFPYVGQGCIFDGADGRWWSMIFQDRGAVGRVPTIMPCVWEDGWPMLGNSNGAVPLIVEQVSDQAVVQNYFVDDEFNKRCLGYQWQWNHNPVNSAWSLSEAPGFLRLKTSRVVDNVYLAPNTISQRMMGPSSSAEVKLCLANMRDGDVAGFGAFNGLSGLLSVECKGKEKSLVMHTSEVSLDGDKRVTGVSRKDFERVPIEGDVVYLKVSGDFNLGKDIASFAYSTDGKTWKPIGQDLKMKYDWQKLFMGSRYAIYNYATKKKGGYVDVDYFHCSTAPQNEPVLSKAIGDRYLTGVAMSVRNINDEKARNLAARHFNSIVAENCMKMEEIHPSENHFNYMDADKLVDFGMNNDMKIIGHCLIWHSQCPFWFCHDEKGNLVKPEILKQRMKHHITTVVTRYKGKIHGWDVVNEAIEGDGSWRNSDFYKILGEEFIPLAFQYAHEADPDVELYYNDYGMDMEGRRNRVVELIRTLKSRGLRIDAVGMQTHADLKNPRLSEYEKSMLAYAAEGVKVMATEFDVSILPFVTRSANISDRAEYKERLNPYKKGVPHDVQREWNKRISDFYALWTKHSDIMSRVTVWGLTDGDSWKNNFPIGGRTDYPLLFDRHWELKPVVYDIMSKNMH